MRGSRGQKNDTGCRWQRREHNPPFRRSSEHSAARRAASSGRLHSPHSRPPVSRRRGSGVGQGLWRPPGFNGRENVRTADMVLDDCHPFALRIKGVRGCPQRFRSRHFSSLPACFGWWSGFKPGGCFGRIWDKYGYHWPVYLGQGPTVAKSVRIFLRRRKMRALIFKVRRNSSEQANKRGELQRKEERRRGASGRPRTHLPPPKGNNPDPPLTAAVTKFSRLLQKSLPFDSSVSVQCYLSLSLPLPACFSLFSSEVFAT